MDVLSNIGMGFSIALNPINLAFCFIGVLFGTLVGVLPGLGSIAAMALLMPMTFKLQPVTGIIMLAGIFYGSMYGGSTTSILVSIPGEVASIITCLDGHQMARQGRAGPALGIVAFGSFIAGTLGVIGLMLFAPVLGQAALSFGPPEFFALTFMALAFVTYLSRGSILKGLIMAILGLFAGCIGMDPVSGIARFSYGSFTLMDGLGMVVISMGLFGVAEILTNVGQPFETTIYEKKIKGLLPNLKDWKASFWPIIRGTVIGFFVGLLPGPSVTISTFASYATEKKLSRYPEKFGTGVIEGVAGPESANNAAASSAFVPLLSLGLPANITMALFMGALMIHGIAPGPLFISQYPDLFWGVIASMYVGNVMLLVLNLPLIGMWVSVLRIPYVFLYPIILLLCVIGVYSLNGNVVEIFIMLLFGLLGLLMRRGGFEAVPFLLALVLGPIMEKSLRQSLLISHGNLGIFFTRPVSAVLMSVGIISLISPLVFLKKKKGSIIAEMGDI